MVYAIKNYKKQFILVYLLLITCFPLLSKGQVFLAENSFNSHEVYTIPGIMVASSPVLLLIDNDIRTLAKKVQSPTADVFAKIFKQFGEPHITAIIGGGIFLAGIFDNSQDLKDLSLMLGESVLLAGASTIVLKVVFGRKRPYKNLGPYQFGFFEFKADSWSYPSGHTAVAFANASVLAAEIDKPVATISLYGLAVLTAFSRIYNDKHWLSDTVFGAAVGTFSGLFIYNINKKDKKNDNSEILLPPITLKLPLINIKF